MNSRLQHGFRLGGREIRPLEGRILGPDDIRHVHPKAMEVLLCLAERQGQVVRRDKIIDRVWGHRHGSDNALTRCISELREALTDRNAQNRLIETIPKRGYRLVASVSPADAPAEADEEQPAVTAQPSIAVLPFRNMSGHPEQEYFSDGITEDIITDLSRVGGLFVIARNSTFTFKDRSPTAAEVSRKLGVRYVLEGSVRRARDRIRVTAQLTDASTGAQIWAERYDRGLEDIFAVQDDLTGQIVSVLAVTLTTERNARRRSDPDMATYEYILRGRELAWLHKRETGTEARRLLAQAIWLDPSCAAAYSWLAFAHTIEYVNRWSEAPEESLRVADELARKAVKLDENDAQAHFVLGECYLWARRDHESAMHESKRAIELDPNYSHAHLLLGHALHYAGRSGESLQHFEKAMRLDPCYPDLYLHFVAQSYYSLGRYREAIALLQRRLARNPDTDISHVLLAACHGRLGQIAQAKPCWDKALTINPAYSIDEKRRVLPYKNPADFEDFTLGLREANLLN